MNSDAHPNFVGPRLPTVGTYTDRFGVIWLCIRPYWVSGRRPITTHHRTGDTV